jgi:sugar diacid utilization regulator
MQKALSGLTATALARMERDMPWFRELSAEQRSWVGMVVHAGMRSFIAWYRDPRTNPALESEVFGPAPRSFAGVVTLQQTVAMIRLTIEVVEENIDEHIAPEDVPGVEAAVLRYGRELAFATADIYARAAEMRGAWDARLEALLVDSVMRAEAEDAVLTRAGALGWSERRNIAVVVGAVPLRPRGGATRRATVFDDVRRSARLAEMEALCAVQADRLVVVLSDVVESGKAAAVVEPHFGDGPVVAGPVVAGLPLAHVSAQAAVAGLRAAPGWPGAPRPVTSDDLLPERALDGDEAARRELVTDVYAPLRAAGESTLQTVSAYLDQGASVEGAARVLFVHPNTVRYRLRRAADATGLTPGDPRHGYTLRVALTLGRLSEDEEHNDNDL